VSRVDVSTMVHRILGRRDATQVDNGVSIELSAATASRRHAAVAHDADGRMYLMDLNSTNGTFINGQRLEPAQWYPWDPGAEGSKVTFGTPAGDCENALLVSSPLVLPIALKRKREDVPMSESVCHRSSSDITDEVKVGDTLAAPGVVEDPPKKKRCSDSGPIAVQSHSPNSIRSAGAPLPKSCVRDQAPPRAVAEAKPSVQPAARKKCDKCDGPHATDACPHFRKARETHKDAWANYGKKSPMHMGGAGGNFVLRNARVVRQPGDGSCLFHSLCYGLNSRARDNGARAFSLRRELAHFVARHPQLEIAGDTLEEWVRWDANTTCGNYANRMASGGWGGGIEMAACSLLKQINVHVYEQQRQGQFKRISCFNNPSAPKTSTIHVLYQGRNHYDALWVN